MNLSEDEEFLVDELFYDSLLKFGFRGLHTDPACPEAVALKKALTDLCTSHRPKMMGKLVNILV